MSKDIFTELEFNFRRFYGRLFKYGRSKISEFGLSDSQFNIIVAIYFHGSQSLKDLCESLMLAPSTISEMIVRMEDAGLVVKERDRDDKRKIIIGLTEESRKIVNSVIEARVKYVKKISSGIEKETLLTLSDTLSRMLECRDL